MARSVVTWTTAPAGSGKTYRRGPSFLVEDFLVNSKGIHYSNMPLDVKKIEEYMSRKGINVKGRVVVIPESVLKSWRVKDGVAGPWDYFSDTDLTGCHIAIDECHHYVPRRGELDKRALWQKWIGEIRHRGCTVEFLSQSPEKVAKEIISEAEVKLSIVNSELRRDPFFRIQLSDWYELRAGLWLREYISSIWEIEYRKVDEKWEVEDKRVTWFKQEYFDLYDSYSLPQATKGVKAKVEKKEFEKRGRFGISFWFFRKNLYRLGSRVAVIVLIMYLMFGGGGRIMSGFMNRVQAAASSAHGRKKVQAIKKKVTLESLESENKSLREQLVNKSNMVIKLESEVRKAERVEDAWAVSAIGRGWFMVRTGQIYHEGEEVKWGKYEGEKVTRIDYEGREVVLDSGRVIRVGVFDAKEGGDKAGVKEGIVGGGVQQLPEWERKGGVEFESDVDRGGNNVREFSENPR